MKAFIIFAVLAVASAAPQFNNQYSSGQASKTVYKQTVYQQEAQAPAQPEQKPLVSQYTQTKSVLPPIAITSFERNVQPGGDYQFSYGTEHGININEDAKIKEIRDEKNEPHHVPAVTGSYSYVGDDGQTYTVNYIADEFGFRASGAHLPQAPAVPKEIEQAVKSLPPLPKDEPEQQVQQQVVQVEKVQQVQQRYQPLQYQQQYQQKQYNQFKKF